MAIGESSGDCVDNMVHGSGTLCIDRILLSRRAGGGGVADMPRATMPLCARGTPRDRMSINGVRKKPMESGTERPKNHSHTPRCEA